MPMTPFDKSAPRTGGTRGRIIAHLRRAHRTVDELAAEVGTTDNSVRSHLTALERDGVVRQEGTRRNAGAGKPAVLFGLHPDAESAFSNAYPPVLNALLDAVVSELSRQQATALLESVGHRLAQSVGGEAKGSLRRRVEGAAAVLTALGGDVEVIDDGEQLLIRGFGCPLSRAVISHPESCHAVTTLMRDVTGSPVVQCCEHGDRPQCRFRVG
ncbi:MAG: helix-turn-helix domain-containing protein [Gemmatimonadaceae bacterium]